MLARSLCLLVLVSGCASESDAHGDAAASDAAAGNRPDANLTQLQDAGSRDAGVRAAQPDAARLEPDAHMAVLDAGPAGDAASAQPVLGPVQTPGDPGAADVMIEVHADMDSHPISPLVYGTNGAPDIARNHQTVVRSGGNRMTAYNWENNASNAGSDYQYQNDNYLSDSNEPAKPILDGVNSANMNGATAIVTVPIVDYVAGDKSPGGDVRNSGNDYLSKRFKQNKPDKGSALAATPDSSDAFVYQDEFVAYLKAHAGSARVIFSLDNEPDLWSSTHAEVHPNQVTYAELWDRNQRYASAVKRAWSDAEVTGFVSYGWNGYVNLQNASDANGRDFIEWYLDQAKAAEAKGGKRLIDYLDLHWYPEAQGGGTRITEASTAADVVAAREQAPRSLWDPSYNEQSWIHDTLNAPIDLVHRILGKIAAHYPGTRLAFTEWNYGGGDHISGAIASADVLGIFGRERVSLATHWALSGMETFTYAAFRAYRNFDGKGGKFGDTSLRASSSDVANVSVYASLQASAPDQVVLIAINKATTTKNVGLRLWHSSAYNALHVYELSGTTADLSKKADQASTAKNAWRLSLPSQSVSVLVPAP
jgi:hypothetical protein